MEYCTFIDNVHMYKNKDLCSNYGAFPFIQFTCQMIYFHQ